MRRGPATVPLVATVELLPEAPRLIRTRLRPVSGGWCGRWRLSGPGSRTEASGWLGGDRDCCSA